MWLRMFCFRSILQIWIILIGFQEKNSFVNLGICKHESNSPVAAIADLPEKANLSDNCQSMEQFKQLDYSLFQRFGHLDYGNF